MLIVEDEEAFATFLATVATGVGYAARSVTRSQEFEFQLSEWKPTVLFLDVFMPDRDGLELLQKHAYDGSLIFNFRSQLGLAPNTSARKSMNTRTRGGACWLWG